MINKLNQIAEWKKDNRFRGDNKVETYIVQKYIDNPCLIGGSFCKILTLLGKKFDLRVYLLVTSYQPLTAYLYRSGFARFSRRRFSNNPKDIDNACMSIHLQHF